MKNVNEVLLSFLSYNGRKIYFTTFRIDTSGTQKNNIFNYMLAKNRENDKTRNNPARDL